MEVGLIGMGAMGRMLVNAHFAFGNRDAYDLTIASRDTSVLDALRSDHEALRVDPPSQLAERAEMVFVCVPPFPYLDVVSEIAHHLTADKIFVCISNGVPIDELGALMEAPVVKIIPSMAHCIGRGVSLVTPGPRAEENHVRAVEAFIRPFAMPYRVTPQDMRLASNITGCGPAVMAHFVNILVNESAERTTDASRADLFRLAGETFFATAQLIENGMTPQEIADEAATGGGTTEMALQTLTEPLQQAISAMIAATQAREDSIRARSSGTENDKGG